MVNVKPAAAKRVGIVSCGKRQQKTNKKKNNEPLDIRWRYDAYMYGLGGAKSENVEKPFVLKVLLKGSRGA